MARPTKLGLDYFTFDIDMFEDEKVLPVSVEFGAKGESVVVRVLCAIYREGYFVQWSEGLKFKIANQAKLSEGLVSDVVLKLIKYHFFNEEIFNQHQVLTSAGIQKRWKEATRKRVYLEKKEFWLLDKPEFPAEETHVSGGRKAEETPLNRPETTQKKRNKIKSKEEKESDKKNYRFSPPSLEDIENYFSEKIKENNITMNAKNEAVKFEAFYSSKNWFVGKNKMTDWKKAVGGWIARSKPFEQQKSITYSKPDFRNKFK